MKTLTLVNTDELLATALSNYYDISNDGDISNNVFIDWLCPKDNMEQIGVLEEAIKLGSYIVMFDRYQSLRQHEIDWLLRYKNVKLFEPSLITRRGFKHMPFWYELYRFGDTVIEKTEDVGYVMDEKRPNILYEYDLPLVGSYDKIKLTVVFGSEGEYNRGYLPDLKPIIYNRCLPLLPRKHKYFLSLFSGLIVDSKKDIDWCVNVLRLYDVLIETIYELMDKYFPEMKVGNVANQINLAFQGR